MATAESVIRRMSRLAVRHGAINLAQGFTDEAPPYRMVWAAVAALLGGTSDGIAHLEKTTLRDLGVLDDPDRAEATLAEVLEPLRNPSDVYSQYSFPFGLPELREAIAAYTDRWQHFRPDPEREVTVVLGATEGLASIFSGLCQPGDGVIVVQPFHEMYPSQAGVFGLRPIYVTLREQGSEWHLDRDELAAAAGSSARLLVLNSPHNPTGKVFTTDELQFVADLALEHDLIVVTDEIYEHLTYDQHRHRTIATLPGMRDRTVVVNSLSKTGNATGWRVGWVIAPEPHTTLIRGVHDALVVQAPTPFQKAAVQLLEMPDSHFDQLRGRYTVKRRALVTALQQVGFRFTVPQGAYYLFADYSGVPALSSMTPTEAAIFLIEQVGVATVPGDNFYATATGGTSHLRFAFCRGLDALEEAATRLKKIGSPRP